LASGGADHVGHGDRLQTRVGAKGTR
jgi:hypothetical protein